MKTHFRKAIVLAALLVSFQSQASVGSFCIDDIPNELTADASLTQASLLVDVSFLSPKSCRSISGLRTGLKVVSLGLTAGSIVAACGVVTAPFAAGISIGAGVTDLLTGSIELACDGDETPSPEEVQVYLCTQLEAQGLTCDPHLQIKMN